ncbi:tetratricopeptide repeat protein [Streptomyces sp. NBC_01231]|nr:tetratricopeptide repeat protein [Streptomyces sp. NBC_01231]
MDILDSEGLKRHNAFPQDFNVDRLELIIEALQTLSLLDITEVPAERHETQPAITVHNLVLEANRIHLATASQATQVQITRTAVELLEVATEMPPEDRAHHHWWSLLYPHIMEITCSTEMPSSEIAEPLLAVGLRNFAYMNLAFRNPMKQAASALRAISDQLDPSHPLRLAARHRYAWAHLRGVAATMEFRELYKIGKETLGESHPETLMCHHNWAEQLAESGRNKEAERELRKVLKAREEQLEKGHPYVLFTHRGLIRVIEAQRGGTSRTEIEWEKIYSSVRSAENQGLADLETLHLLGHWLDKKERWTEAEECYRTIIDALDSTPTEGRHFCESMRHCLAQNLIRQGRLDESASTYRERLKLLEQTRPAADRELLSMRHDYADLLVDLERMEEAEPLMRSVLEVRLASTHRARDKRLVAEAHCLIHLLEHKDNREEAASTARMLLRLPKEELVAWSKLPQLADDMLCICRTLSDTGSYGESISGLEALVEGVPPNSKEAYSIQRTLALTQYASGLIDQSFCEQTLVGIMESLEAEFGAEDEEIERTRDVLLGLRGDLGKATALGEPEAYSNEESESLTSDDH